MASNSPRPGEQRSLESEREQIIEQAERAPGIAELMQVYESAEAGYMAAVAQPGVRVASSTNPERRDNVAHLG